MNSAEGGRSLVRSSYNQTMIALTCLALCHRLWNPLPCEHPPCLRKRIIFDYDI